MQSSTKLGHYENEVDDKHIKVSGGKYINNSNNWKMSFSTKTLCVILLFSLRQMYNRMSYPMLCLSPLLLNFGDYDNEEWYDARSTFPKWPTSVSFNDHGEWIEDFDYVIGNFC